ncbi:MAG TPA: hypothetical protein DEA22_11685 [Blastocatellia bacterium]|nr:hypothetical protein [Blastocatellia bacterium]
MTIPEFEKQLKDGGGSAANVEIAENFKAGFRQLPQSLGKAPAKKPERLSHLSHNTAANNKIKKETREFFVLKT